MRKAGLSPTATSRLPFRKSSKSVTVAAGERSFPAWRQMARCEVSGSAFQPLIGNWCARRYDRRCADGFAGGGRGPRATLPSCELGTPTVRSAVKQAEIVFRGTITQVRNSEIVFRVEAVWKGRVPPVFAMPKVIATTRLHVRLFGESNQEWGRTPRRSRRSPQAGGSGDVAQAGSRTALVQDAAEDLRRLGRGRPPTICVIRHPGRTQ